jgi:hypothetical protein
MAAFDTGRRLAALEREHTPDKVTRIIIQGAGKPDGPAATMQQLTPDLLKLERSLQKADEVLFQTFDEALGVGDTLTAKDVRARFDAEAQKARTARQEAQDSWG